VHNNLGAALAQMGRISEAIEQLKAALCINPNYIDARNNLTKLEALQKTTPEKNEKPLRNFGRLLAPLREGGTRCLQRVAKIDAALPPDILGLRR
jgi:tetratricopeptide (TPR) repeat protein